MANAGIKVDVLFDRSLLVIPAVRAAVLEAAKSTADAIRDEAERTAPQEHENRIGKSITVEPHPRKAEPEVWVGAAGEWAYLARFHEFGTVKMEADPFMAPAAEGARTPHEGRVAEAVNRATGG